ncbi:MAG: hypothetical protein ABI333_23540 [bacterium]
MLLLLLARPAGAEPAPATGERLPVLAVLVAQTFLRSVVDRDLVTAAPLCADAVSFDGQLVRGKQVPKRLSRMFARMKVSRRLQRVVVMSLQRARQLFGPPPARLKLLQRKDLIVGFGRFRRGGLVVVLAPERDRWRIVALTD